MMVYHFENFSDGVRLLGVERTHIIKQGRYYVLDSTAIGPRNPDARQYKKLLDSIYISRSGDHGFIILGDAPP